MSYNKKALSMGFGQCSSDEDFDLRPRKSKKPKLSFSMEIEDSDGKFQFKHNSSGDLILEPGQICQNHQNESISEISDVNNNSIMKNIPLSENDSSMQLLTSPIKEGATSTHLETTPTQGLPSPTLEIPPPSADIPPATLPVAKRTRSSSKIDDIVSNIF